MRVETRRGGGKAGCTATNGQGDWQILPDGTSVPTTIRPVWPHPAPRAFFAPPGYFHRARLRRPRRPLGVRQFQGREFDVDRPSSRYGGDPRELWFDRRTTCWPAPSTAAAPGR